MNKTIQYYNKRAYEFVNSTIDVNISDIQDQFLLYVPLNGIILDFGCGSGRDTKYFIGKGYRVDAIDGSEELCKIASEFSGISVKYMLFQNLNEKNKYDGIWACSSILHLPKVELNDVFSKMIMALKNDGIMYVSFKYGNFEGIRDERYFCDFTENSFGIFSANFESVNIEKQWISEDVRPGRGNEKWLNIILKKINL